MDIKGCKDVRIQGRDMHAYGMASPVVVGVG